jgi:hypothetical protein
MMSSVFKCLAVTKCQLIYRVAWSKPSKIALNNLPKKEKYSKFSQTLMINLPRFRKPKTNLMTLERDTLNWRQTLDVKRPHKKTSSVSKIHLTVPPNLSIVSTSSFF